MKIRKTKQTANLDRKPYDPTNGPFGYGEWQGTKLYLSPGSTLEFTSGKYRGYYTVLNSGRVVWNSTVAK